MSIDKDRHRMALSIKQCIENPWKNFLSNNPLGNIINCTVSHITDAGLYVSIEDKIEGFISSYDISWDRYDVKNKNRNYKVGQKIEAKIIRANLNKGKLYLGIKQIVRDPFQNFLQKINVNDIISATIVKIDEEGFIIKISNDEELVLFFPQDQVSNLTHFIVGKNSDFKIIKKENYKIHIELIH